jgi:hypothetical protein
MSFALRVTLIWALLSGVTILSWWLGSEHEGQVFELNFAITLAVVFIALFKMRFIMREFMEVRTAPAWIKYVSDAWLATVFVCLLVAYHN